MKRLLAIGMLFILWTGPAWARDPAKEKSTPDEMLRMQIKHQSRLTELLASIQDETSAKAALPKLQQWMQIKMSKFAPGELERVNPALLTELTEAERKTDIEYKRVFSETYGKALIASLAKQPSFTPKTPAAKAMARLLQERINLFLERADVLAEIKDSATAQAALPKLKQLNKNAEQLQEKLKKVFMEMTKDQTEQSSQELSNTTNLFKSEVMKAGRRNEEELKRLSAHDYARPVLEFLKVNSKQKP